MNKIPGSKVTPLWVVAAFVTLTEMIVIYATTKSEGGIAIALTAFAISFGFFVTIAFFAILWKRPYVFYPPSEYGNADPAQFIEALRTGVDDFEINLEQINERLNVARSAIAGLNDRSDAGTGARPDRNIEKLMAVEIDIARKDIERLRETTKGFKKDLMDIGPL